MEDLRFQEIENRTQAWDFSTQQGFYDLLKTIKEASISAEEWMDYVEEKRSRRIRENEEYNKKARERLIMWNNEWNEKAKRCPECGASLSLGSMGDNPKGYKHQWYCINDGCSFIEEFGYETVDELYEQMGIDLEKYRRPA